MTLTQKGTLGTPALLGPVRVGIANFALGGSATLQSADWGASISATLQAPLALNGNGATSTIQFTTNELQWIDATLNGRTQMRISFQSATNGDGNADQVHWYTGDSTTAAWRPKLEVRYSAPHPVPLENLARTVSAPLAPY